MILYQALGKLRNDLNEGLKPADHHLCQRRLLYWKALAINNILGFHKAEKLEKSCYRVRHTTVEGWLGHLRNFFYDRCCLRVIRQSRCSICVVASARAFSAQPTGDVEAMAGKARHYCLSAVACAAVFVTVPCIFGIISLSLT